MKIKILLKFHGKSSKNFFHEVDLFDFMIFLAWNFLIFWPAVCTEKQANVRSAEVSAHCIMKIAKHHIHVTFPTFRPPLRWSKHIATMQVIFLCFYFWFFWSTIRILHWNCICTVNRITFKWNKILLNSAIFWNKRFALNEMFQRNTSDLP